MPDAVFQQLAYRRPGINKHHLTVIHHSGKRQAHRKQPKAPAGSYTVCNSVTLSPVIFNSSSHICREESAALSSYDREAVTGRAEEQAFIPYWTLKQSK
jgi:hypothetical protein